MGQTNRGQGFFFQLVYMSFSLSLDRMQYIGMSNSGSLAVPIVLGGHRVTPLEALLVVEKKGGTILLLLTKVPRETSSGGSCAEKRREVLQFILSSSGVVILDRRVLW